MLNMQTAHNIALELSRMSLKKFSSNSLHVCTRSCTAVGVLADALDANASRSPVPKTSFQTFIVNTHFRQHRWLALCNIFFWSLQVAERLDYADYWRNGTPITNCSGVPSASGIRCHFSIPGTFALRMQARRCDAKKSFFFCLPVGIVELRHFRPSLRLSLQSPYRNKHHFRPHQRFQSTLLCATDHVCWCHCRTGE